MRKMMSQSLDNEYIIRSNNMALKKEVAKKILKTIKPKPKPKVRSAQGQPAPGTRVGTTQNPASKSVTKSKPNTTTPKSTGFSTRPQATGTRSLKGTPTKKGISNTAKAAGAATVATAAAVALKKKKGGSFDDAFRKARAKGEGTNFTHNGKKYTAVTKDDLKNKGYSSLAAYNKAGGRKKLDSSKAAKKVVSEVNKNKKRKRPLINAAKRILLGKDKKFGGDRGLIDFLGKRKKKPGLGMNDKPKKKADGGMMNSSKPRRSSSRRGVGAAKRGFGKALR